MNPLVTHLGIKHLLTAKAEKTTKHKAKGGFKTVFQPPTPTPTPVTVVRPVSKIYI